MIRRETGGELRQWSLGHGSGLLCYSPMQSGVLTGGFTRERAAALPRDDHRAAISRVPRAPAGAEFWSTSSGFGQSRID